MGRVSTAPEPTLQKPLVFQGSSHQLFWPQGPLSWKTVFPWTGAGGGSRMSQAYNIYCTRYFRHYYISSTSGQLVLDPRGCMLCRVLQPLQPRGL